jgi:ABC-type lipoprotein release transport system permease subunit
MNMVLMYSRIGLRNIRRNGRRSMFTILAIGFGLFCLIVFQALKVGLHREMLHSTLNLDAGAIQVHASGYEPNLALIKPIEPMERIRSVLVEQGIVRSAERIKSPGLVLAGQRSSSVLLSGVVPDQERQVTFIAEKMQKGSYLEEPNALLLGKALADSLQVSPGDKVTLMVQTMFGKAAARKFLVGGIYQTELSSFDQNHVYLNLAAAQDFLGAEGVVSEIALRLSLTEAAEEASLLQKRLGSLFQVRSWEQNLPDLAQLIELNDTTMGLLVFIIFAIVAMGITNTMTTVIFERFSEFGTLAAIGTSPRGIVSLVVLESLFLGAFAACIGGLAGIATCFWLARHGLDLSRFISSNQYFSSGHVLRAFLLPEDFLFAVLVTLATSFVAGLYPAMKAGRLEPVEALVHV